MLENTSSNILETSCEAFVNTVNCVGVMGKGLALQVKIKFPNCFEEYKLACANNTLNVGNVLVHKTGLVTNPKYIISFPTKTHWKYPSKLSYIESGLKALVKAVKEHDIKSLAIPALGCGLGGLNWDDVFPLIIKETASLEIPIMIHGPRGATL